METFFLNVFFLSLFFNDDRQTTVYPPMLTVKLYISEKTF